MCCGAAVVVGDAAVAAAVPVIAVIAVVAIPVIAVVAIPMNLILLTKKTPSKKTLPSQEDPRATFLQPVLWPKISKKAFSPKILKNIFP